MGEMIEFSSNGGSDRGYLALPESGNGPGIIVIQEWWGLVPHIEDVCERFADEGFVALAPDLYHGRTTTEPDEAAKLAMGLQVGQAAKDLSGAVEELMARSSSECVGVVGFCMGGGLALVLGAERDDAVGAVVLFYGSLHWEDVSLDWSRLSAPVLGHFAELDESAGPEWVAELSRRLSEAGNDDVTTFTYPGTQHAFFNDERPEVYDPEAAELAWGRTLQFVRRTLA
ncbi:MAG: Carboxymethylenebutenolidase [Acidimicrobiaceae bacterium]|nr:Carboxymethylenebutenolidase [Acidimicrobiaceae bacterium]